MKHSSRIGQSSNIVITVKEAFIAFVITTVYLAIFLTRATGIPVRSLLDLIVLSIAAVLIANSIIRKSIKESHLAFFLSVFGFTLISFLGSLNPSITNSIISSIIFSKLIIVFFFARHLTLENLKFGMSVLAAIHLFGSILSFTAPGPFEALLPSTTYQLDTSRLMGFSLNANRAATTSSTIFIYYAIYRKKVALSLVFFVLLVLSESRSITAVTGIIFTFLAMKSKNSLSNKMTISIIIILVFAFLMSFFISLEDTVFKIQNTISGDLRYIRAAMLMGGISLANEFYPLGVGGGLFGSSMSRGSEAYEIVGISHWDTVIDMTGVFDSGFGAILGEYGYLGLLFYIALMFLVMRYALRKPVSRINALFIVALILFMSSFRTVASDFFFSFYILFIFLTVISSSQKGPMPDARSVGSQ